MFLKKELVKIPIEPKILVHYCRDCESTEVETIQICKKCGSHNIASPFSHTLDDYKNGVGTKQKTKEVTKYFYKCDLCGKEFDGFNIDNYLSYGNGEFEGCNYNNFSDAEDVDFINYQLEKDLCSNCKSKVKAYLKLKLIDFTREENVKEIINQYFKNYMEGK